MIHGPVLVSSQSIIDCRSPAPPIRSSFRGIWQLRRAAVTLLMQQSMLSRCIRQLQDALGVTVFERSSGGYARRRPDENFSSNGAIDTRTSGCARYIDALRGIF
jgi:hypothetical protein